MLFFLALVLIGIGIGIPIGGIVVRQRRVMVLPPPEQLVCVCGHHFVSHNQRLEQMPCEVPRGAKRDMVCGCRAFVLRTLPDGR